MQRLILFLTVTLLAGGLLQACGQPAESKHAGVYELDKDVIMDAMQADIAAIADPDERQAMEMGMAMMGAGMFDVMNMTLTLDADGTASSTTSMMGETETVTGRWSAAGDTVTIEMVDHGEPEAITGKITGDSLELHPPDGEEMPFRLVLKRRPQ